jgi:hypothetical protein
MVLSEIPFRHLLGRTEYNHEISHYRQSVPRPVIETANRQHKSEEFPIQSTGSVTLRQTSRTISNILSHPTLNPQVFQHSFSLPQLCFKILAFITWRPISTLGQSMRDMYKVAPEHRSVSKSFGFPPSMITPPVFHIHSPADWGTAKDRSHQRTSHEGPEGKQR